MSNRGSFVTILREVPAFATIEVIQAWGYEDVLFESTMHFPKK